MSFLISNFVKSYVIPKFSDKTRHRAESHNLDFTYVTDRLCAMSFPASGIESLWRNHIDETQRFLNAKHPNSYLIVNLSGREYEYGKLNNSVIDYAFPDHHNPPIELLFVVCEKIHEFMMKDERNIVIVHCLAGRGRTGTICACYLCFNGMFDNGSQALDYFAQKRSRESKGVTQPSQRRYVQYFSEILHGRKGHDRPLRLKRVVMYGIPSFHWTGGCHPVLRIYTSPTQQRPKILLFESQDTRFYPSNAGCIEFEVGCVFQGDLYFQLHHRKATQEKYMLRMSIHTGFVPSHSVLRLTKTEIDDAIKSSKFDHDFFVDLIFEDVKDFNEEELKSASHFSIRNVKTLPALGETLAANPQPNPPQEK
mmetsp:Transcript_6264/g.23542  ORF Transcript_6264/g.23542 Transcript_6264/m.23542 type:complete len:366 (-) Transcript_6264:1396-2493(-)